MNESEIKEGDVVVLKSSPEHKMVVSAVSNYSATCVFFAQTLHELVEIDINIVLLSHFEIGVV